MSMLANVLDCVWALFETCRVGPLLDTFWIRVAYVWDTLRTLSETPGGGARRIRLDNFRGTLKLETDCSDIVLDSPWDTFRTLAFRK